MHHFSVVSKAHPRAVAVWWRGNVVQIADTIVDFDIYKSFLQRTLEETETMVLQKILLGVISMEQVENELGFAAITNLSLGDESVHGKGILLDASDPCLFNSDFNKMSEIMAAAGCLGMKYNKQDIPVYNKKKSLKWLQDVDQALETVMALCHILQGPPGRMSEEAALSLTNTHETRHALFWDPLEGTGGFRSGYHKGAYITGDHKHILRLLPRRIFRLLYILVRLVRPLDFVLVCDFVVSEDRRQSVMDAYRKNIFASMGRGWDANYRHVVLARFFKNGLDINMGTRLYRHFAVAVQRRFPPTKTSEAQVQSRLGAVADIMTGHTTTVAEMHYAMEARPIIGRVAEEEFKSVCKHWHRLHEMVTGSQESGEVQVPVVN